ncbi:calcium-binding protein [Oscillatoria sp. FACHB-1407]|uniref:calcium-binding protein n=1 Tax=Oscillatoria sp. FACHB-1407 TaxID=2692847 RepID=UPI001688BEF5|nr:calcium-binding protein [Oscillatoria sp. FACHB-1407]MBD2463589.1 calcium-binding protein [Oscillatoria sp. FACHB-1407]
MAFLVGTIGNDSLQGGTASDIIIGLAGDDFLQGGAGDDTIRGDAGNDTLVGEAGNDTLMGGDGNDLLSGREGNDRMIGGNGNDRYVVDAIGDVVEEVAGQGIDQVISSISYTLSANVENLLLVGNAFVGNGNSLNNEIRGTIQRNNLFGADGDDTLFGFEGDDTLTGGAGNDTLTGGAGSDTFRFDLHRVAVGGGTDVDLITDFVTGTDRILLTGFQPLGFTDGQVTIVDDDVAAAISDAQLVYSRASGSVFFNENRGVADFGTGGKFATIQGSVLTSGDFAILPFGASTTAPRG